MTHQFGIRIAISCSPRWNGTDNVPSWPCAFCGDSYDLASELRAHTNEQHPYVEIVSEHGVDSPGYQEALAYVESIDPTATAGWRSR